MEQIIYEDDQVLVFHKPSGLAVQTSRFGQQDVVSILKNYNFQKIYLIQEEYNCT